MEKVTHINLLESNEHVELSKFAGGECHVRLKHQLFSENVAISCRLNSSDDFMRLALCVDALRRIGVNQIEAFVPYLPYARQDRVMVPGESLSIKVFARMLNSLHLKKILFFDAHSDVSAALVDRCENIPNHQLIRHFINQWNLEQPVFVAPDLGAYKKIDKCVDALNLKSEIVYGIKIRNLNTREIMKTSISNNNLHGRTCVVVDDICDGGRTFIQLAETLINNDAGALYLIVSHGIFSHDALKNLIAAGYRAIGSSNSISDITNTENYFSYNIFK